MSAFCRLIVFTIVTLAGSNLSAAVVVFDSAITHVTGITDLVVGGVAYDVTFNTPGESFLDIFGPTIPPNPLPISMQPGFDIASAQSQINTLLTTQAIPAIPSGPLLGATGVATTYIIPLAFSSDDTHFVQLGGQYNSLVGGGSFIGNGGSIIVNSTPSTSTIASFSTESTAPEPATVVTWLSLMGIAGVGWLCRRRAALLPSTA